MPKPKGRDGRPWRRLQARVLREETLCHLCLQPVDKDLPHTDPQSATVDHLAPLSHNPHLALDRANLRLAHRHCNSSKGNGNGQHLTNHRRSRNW